MTAALHNDVLQRGLDRAEALTTKLEKLLVPVFEEAGRVAAAAFEQHATNHLTATAELRATDRARVAMLGDSQAARGLVSSLALTAAAPTGKSTMVAVYPRPEEAAGLAEPGAEPASILHCTLCFLGEIDEAALPAMVDELRAVAGDHSALAGEVGGIGSFSDMGAGHPAIMLPDVPGLVELRQAVCEAVIRSGADYSREHGFTPHMTVAYRDSGPEPPAVETLGSPLHFDAIVVARGDQTVAEIPLVGPPAITAAAPPAFCLPAELRTKLDPARLAVVETMTSAALKEAGLSFDVNNPFIGKMLAHTGKQITHISRTTQLDVMRAIRVGYDQGLTIPDTAKLIRASMTDSAPWRATLIARTEMAGAVNGASLAGVQIVEAASSSDSGGEGGGVAEASYEKTWMTAPGAKDPRHELYEGLDGQTVPLDDAFEVGGSSLMYPGDPDGDPEEVCNCRCTMSYTDASGQEQEVDSETASVCPAHGPRVDIDAELAEIVAYLTAAAPPHWTAPAPSEILSVDCDARGHVVAESRVEHHAAPLLSLPVHEGELGPQTIEVWRAGPATDPFGRGVFFGQSPEAVTPYAGLHGAETKAVRYVVETKRTKIFESHNDAYKQLFGKSFNDAIQAGEKRGLTTMEANRVAEKKIAEKLRSQGYDSVIYHSPYGGSLERELAIITKKPIENLAEPLPPDLGIPQATHEVAPEARALEDRMAGSRPWMHYKDSTLTTQIARAKAGVRNTALTDAERVRLFQKLDELQREQAIRRGKIEEPRPFAHYKDSTLTTQLGRTRTALREAADPAERERLTHRLADLEREKVIRKGAPITSPAPIPLAPLARPTVLLRPGRTADSYIASTPTARSGIPRMLAKETETAMQLLDKVFATYGDAKKINITLRKKGQWNKGHFTWGQEINLNPGARWDRSGHSPSVTFWHEWGHFLDGQHLNDAWNGFATRRGGMRGILQAMSQSEAYRTQEQVLAGRGSQWASKKHAAYVHSDVELFARGFAQYVLTKLEELPTSNLTADEHATMARARTALNTDVDIYGSQWEKVDFAPIKEQFDNFFRAKGWLN